MIGEPTRLTKNDLANITYHEDNVIPKNIPKTRKSKSAKSKTVDIFDEADTRVTIGSTEEQAREPTRARTPREYVNPNILDETTCQNPDCTSLELDDRTGLCYECFTATVMPRRTPSSRRR